MNAAPTASATPTASGTPSILVRNRRAHHDFAIVDTYECGIVLNGDEVKAVRAGQAQFNDAFVRIKNNELYLHNMHIAPYHNRDITSSHTPLRVRKLLAHKSEIAKMRRAVLQKGSTLVPLDIHTTTHRLIKLTIAIAKGKKNVDKRETIKKRDIDRDTAREIRHA